MLCSVLFKMFINNLEKRENFKNVNFTSNSKYRRDIKMCADYKGL